jgi:hypothetical protein
MGSDLQKRVWSKFLPVRTKADTYVDHNKIWMHINHQNFFLSLKLQVFRLIVGMKNVLAYESQIYNKYEHYIAIRTMCNNLWFKFS